jgi:hypothetical protein
MTKMVEFDQFFLHENRIEIPPDPPFSKGGNVLLFSETCRHAILSGMRSENSLGISPLFAKPRTPPPLPNPKYLPLYQTPNTLPLYQTPNTLPLYQRGPGGFNDRPKKTPNISPFHLTLEFSRLMPNVGEASAVGKIGAKRCHSAKKAVFAGMARSYRVFSWARAPPLAGMARSYCRNGPCPRHATPDFDGTLPAAPV